MTIVCERYETREEWLQARSTFLGASEIAAILGMGYADQSPITIWAEKVHGTVDEHEKKRLRIGTMMEPVLRQMFTEETGLPCQSVQHEVRRHPVYPFLGATLDGLTTDERDEFSIPVELKNVGQFNLKDWLDEPPLKFQLQVQQQMAVTGAPYCYLFALIGGMTPSVVRLERHERLIAGLVREAERFWGYVERRELPPVDDSEATAKALSRIWREDEGKAILLPSESQEWAERLEAAKEAKKSAEAEERKFANLLKGAIADATFGDVPGFGRFSYKTQTTAAHEVKESTFRVLRRVKVKGY